MIRSSLIHYTVRTVAASVLFSLTTFACTAIAAEGAAPPARSAATAQTTAVTTPASPAAGAGSKASSDTDEMRIKTLHDKLQIKAPQEALWKEVAQVMRSNDEKIDAMTTDRHDKAATMTAVEDLRSYGEISEEHAMGTKRLVPVFEKLYDSMSAEQKSVADKVFRGKGAKSAGKSK